MIPAYNLFLIVDLSAPQSHVPVLEWPGALLDRSVRWHAPVGWRDTVARMLHVALPSTINV
jgi:hypothetical protein